MAGRKKSTLSLLSGWDKVESLSGKVLDKQFVRIVEARSGRHVGFFVGKPDGVYRCWAADLKEAEVQLKSQGYKSIKMTVLANGVFSLWMMGMVLPCFFGFRDAYLESLKDGYGETFVETLRDITPDWMFFVMMVLCFVGGILGGILGTAVLKKHFKKAGMA